MASVIKQRFPFSGLWWQSEQAIGHITLDFLFFAATGRKANTDDGDFQRQNRGKMSQLTFIQGQQVPKSYFMTLKIPHVFPKCYFHTGNYCSRGMWPLSEEQIIIVRSQSGKKEPTRQSVLKWGPSHYKIFISCADGFKDINYNLIFPGFNWLAGFFFAPTLKWKEQILDFRRMQSSAHYSSDGILVPVSVVLISCSVYFSDIWQAPVTGCCRHISQPMRR